MENVRLSSIIVTMMNQGKPGKLWIGPSGWSYDDWHGVVYPRRKPRGFKPLAYIGRFFNAVEVNSSFYRIPTARMTAGWSALVPVDFRFAIKLNQIFTHQRENFPERESVVAFNKSLEPIRAAGRLGPLLMQFPWSFRYTPESLDWLRRLAEAFPDYERFVEVRHASWARPEALAALREIGGFCNIDQPRLRDCLEPTQHVFGKTAYVRLHGRNAAKWFADDVPSYERYNYLYSEEELSEWGRKIDGIMERADYTYVFMNNHYYGQGPANALELRAKCNRERVAVPPTLLDTYPRLAAIARPPREPGLFDQLTD
ncbi:MAG: DUF72 domain-containing protein [Planctomycetota bacterium]